MCCLSIAALFPTVATRKPICYGLTMSGPLDHLRALRDQCRQELEKSELFVAWRELADAVKRAEARLGTPTQSNCAGSPLGTSLQVKYAPVGTTAQKAEEIINQYGRPVRTLQLLDELKRAGVAFEGANPVNNLKSALSKSPRLVSVKIGPNSRDDRGWWINGKPIPGEAASMDEHIDDVQKNSAPPALADEAVNGSGS
jgi:hypothetical protein